MDRKKLAFLVALLVLGGLYRLFAAYPLELARFAPASSALQAMHILDGERPIFYSGQAWMGPAGAYLIALLFKLFGASTLTLGLFSWLVSVLFVLGSVLLAYRLFGIDVSLATAALFLVPVDYLMYLAGQPRAHYTVTFVLVPALFLATVALVQRGRAERPLPAGAFLLGLLAGFSFWTNMAIGPAVAVSMLVLLRHLRRRFFTRVIPPWLAGWAVGFSPVIWYNLTREALLVHQVNADNTARLGRVVAAFATNAWPRFWGILPAGEESPVPRALLVLLAAWIAVLFAGALLQGISRWRRGEDLLGYEIVFGYLFLHLAVTSVSSYGARFETGSPLSYVGPLYGVAFIVPGLWLTSRLPRPVKALALLPLALFVANNLAATSRYPKRFLAAVGEDGLSRVTSYPNEANNFLRFFRARGLSAGYLGRSFKSDNASHMNFLLNLECYGEVVFTDPSGDRYVANALAVDAARDIFWVRGDAGYFAQIGAASRTAQEHRWTVHTDFAIDRFEAKAVGGRPEAAAPDSLHASFMADGNYDTTWSAGPQELDGAAVEFALDRPARLRRLVIFPVDVRRSPASFTVDISGDGVSWRRAAKVENGVPIFWSVWHPFLKAVRPRMEVALLPDDEIRFCRLRFDRGWNTAGIGIREIRFLEDGPAISPGDWEREIDDVAAAVRERGRGAVVAGDHWFMNYFRREGFETAFISNEAVDDNGRPNPDLAGPVPLDLSRPHLLIVSAAFVPSVEERLRGRGVAFTGTPLRYHTLMLTAPAADVPQVFWNGLDLDDLARDASGRIAVDWPPLSAYAAGAAPAALRFGADVEVTGTAAGYDPAGRLLHLAVEARIPRETEREWYLFIHVRDAGGETVAQGDVRLEQLGHPTSRWAAGARAIVERDVEVPVGAGENLSAVIGVYDPRWHRRLRLPGGGNEAVIWRE